jgi:hypothetical protein
MIIVVMVLQPWQTSRCPAASPSPPGQVISAKASTDTAPLGPHQFDVVAVVLFNSALTVPGENPCF